LPYDVPFAVRRFLEHFRPRAGLLVETELWPNLTAAVARTDVPLLLINARLSERSAQGYRRVALLSRPLLRAIAGIAAQSEADAGRLRDLGAQHVVVTGNLKFDVAVTPAQRHQGAALRALFGADRPVLMLASTRDGEEALLLDALARTDALPAATLIVIVPRHPQRFDAVAALLDERRVPYARRSANAPIGASTRVVLGDSLGEMFAYYGACDVAFVAGSLLPLGGQNLIESIAVGAPTLIGPHMFNFAEASEAALAAGAALRIRDADEMFAVAARLLGDRGERERMRENAQTFIAAHRGAIDRLWAWLEPRLAVADAKANRSTAD
jgi:3-deoxy-D-manno-octulosonic-acid transferase